MVLNNLTFNIEAGERIAIIGPNGVGKTTLMRCLAGELHPTSGRIVWVENAQPGYMPQDPQAEFEPTSDLFTWMSQYTGKADDDQIVRATLGRLLFSGEETKKSVSVLSGGEKGRMIYGKLMLTRPNVLLDGRTHQPHGHGNHRVAADRPRALSPGRWFSSRTTASSWAVSPRASSSSSPRRHDRFQGHLRRIPDGAGHRAIDA